MKSDDFLIGQIVECADPEVFLQPARSYLAGKKLFSWQKWRSR